MTMFRLKVGSHAIGTGESLVFYDANDPLRNVFESDQQLDKIDPAKFEKYEGPPVPARSEMLVHGEMLPPPPPGPLEYADAEMARAMGQLELKQRAERLREMAKILEERAEGTAKTTEQAKEAYEQREEKLSVGQRFGQAESHQLSAEAPKPEPPERVEGPVPQEQDAYTPEQIKQKQEEEKQRQDKERQQGKDPGPATAPGMPATMTPDQRARQAQTDAARQQGGQQAPPGAATRPAPAGAAQKFKAMPPDRQKAEDAKLNNMNSQQLRALAEEEEIEVAPNANKADLTQAIRKARQG
jgi:hypothetical protein